MRSLKFGNVAWLLVASFGTVLNLIDYQEIIAIGVFFSLTNASIYLVGMAILSGIKSND